MNLSAISPELLVDRIATIMRGRLPAGVSSSYFDGFMNRNRRAMVQLLGAKLAKHAGRVQGTPATSAAAPGWSADLPAELWAPSQRTQANLRAMEVLAKKEPEELTDEDRRTIAMYSGWGGLSIERVSDRFPEGFPKPDSRGLIHEYYIFCPRRIRPYKNSYLRCVKRGAWAIRAGFVG